MKKHKKGKSSDVINIGKEDWKGKKNFPTAPGGKYRVKFNVKKSKIVPNAKGTGNNLQLFVTITSLHNGKKTPHAGIDVLDNIAPHVGWKIAQLLKSIGIKKLPKKTLTLKDLLELIKKYRKEIRVVLGIDRYQGKKKNNVTMYLPLEASKDEDDDDIEDDDDDEDEDEDQDEDDEDDDDSEDDDGDSDDDDDEDEDEDSDEDEDEDEDDDEDDDEDEDEDEDDDDEDEPRAKKSKSKSKKRKTRR